MEEIERKYLVNTALWSKFSKPDPKVIKQGYLLANIEKTVRVRIKGDKGFLTIKGATQGISRTEFEYEIPVAEANQLLDQFTDKYIDKLRYEVRIGNHVWEVDEFQGKLAPLIVAEIELQHEDETFELPEWVTQEVSDDPSFYNANLINRC